MTIFINGEPTEFTQTTLQDVLQTLGLHERRCATMLNGEIIRRADRQGTTLKDGDQVELISMVGGG